MGVEMEVKEQFKVDVYFSLWSKLSLSLNIQYALPKRFKTFAMGSGSSIEIYFSAYRLLLSEVINGSYSQDCLSLVVAGNFKRRHGRTSPFAFKVVYPGIPKTNIFSGFPVKTIV